MISATGQPHQAGTDAAVDPCLFAPATCRCSAKVCVVAEVGVTHHDVSVRRALELVQMAAESGADTVKLQLFDPDHWRSNQAALPKDQEGSATDVRSTLERFKLCIDEMLAVRAATRWQGLDFAIIPFSLADEAGREDLDPDILKISLLDAANLPLPQLTVSFGRPMRISTDADEFEELVPFVELIQRHLSACCLLHCASSYPVPCSETGEFAMWARSRRFGLTVDNSDHTVDLHSGAFAVASGVCVVEKHLTYDQEASGPDHAASFDPEQFVSSVKFLRPVTTMLGTQANQYRDINTEVCRICRQSICVKRHLCAGDALSREDITIKRPGTGTPAVRLDGVAGSTLARPVWTNDLLCGENLVGHEADTMDNGLVSANA